MRIEDQVCSLELAKRLKELGVKQISLFSWQIGLNKIPVLNISFMGELGSDDYSAFTVAELGEMLPESFATYRKNNKYMGAWDKEWDLIGKLYAKSENEANARAKMLIYLIENGLIKKES